jgi:hypothetical protein
LSRSPAPTVEELLAQMERQPPAPQESTEPGAAVRTKWWPQKRRRALHPLLLLQKRQRPQRRKRRHPPKLDWWTSPASSAPDRDGGPVKLVSVESSRVVLDMVVVLD